MTTRREVALQLLLDETRRQLDIQLQWLDALDAKLGIYFSVLSAELGIIALVLSSPPFDYPRLSVLAIAVAGYVWAAYIAIHGLRGQIWGKGPSLDLMADAIGRGDSHEKVLGAAIKSYSDAHKENRPQYEEKKSATRWALKLLAGESVVTVLALLVVAAHHT